MALRGLTINASRQLVRDGARFRNIGLNYVSAIQRIYSQPSPTACAYTPSSEQDQIIALAQSAKVKVLRVNAFPFYPAQWTYGVLNGKAWNVATAGDREAHYLKIDAFLAKCRSADISVILNCFFRPHSVSDLVGANGRTWLSAGNTRTFAQTITTELVTRYINDDTVAGYELANEINHYNDATDANRGPFPGSNAGYGTLASYSAANDLFAGADWSNVVAWFYGVVSAIDSQRIVMTGNGPNAYFQRNGTLGITGPMHMWHKEQVRDNPTNCGSIHWYGNVGYSSSNFRGLNAALTGIKHWQKQAGRAFVVGEFGNQPWGLTAINSSGGVATMTVTTSCPMEAGDPFKVGLTTGFDGEYTVLSINATRDTITAACSTAGTWSGSAKLQHMTPSKVARMCNDIRLADVDVALFWCVDTDPLTPPFESLTYPGNEGLVSAIRDANTALGW
jgi:hypothetical protein